MGGPGQRSRYSESLRAGRSEDVIPVVGVIFRNRQDRPWGPPGLLYNGYWVSFPGVNWPGRGVDHPPHLAPRLKKECGCTVPLLLLWAFVACSMVNFTFIYIYIYIHTHTQTQTHTHTHTQIELDTVRHPCLVCRGICEPD